VAPWPGTGLSNRVAEDNGLIKNHWNWRVLINGEQDQPVGQIRFGFNFRDPPSVPSDQAQYAPSGDRPFSSGGGGARTDYAASQVSEEGAKFSPVGSVKKPPLVSSEGHGSAETNSPSKLAATKVHGSAEATSAGANSPSKLAATEAHGGSIVMQPLTEGPPVLGVLDIAVRPRAEATLSTRFTCSFRLKPGTTFHELLHAMISRNMEPFLFRKIGMAYLGCRDGMCAISHYLSPAPSLINVSFFFLCSFLSRHAVPRPLAHGRRSHAGSPLHRGYSQARAHLLSPRMALLSPSRPWR
jgi:hypothetical protein